MGQHRLDTVDAAAQVHGENPLPVCGRDVLKLVLLRNAGVVDQQRYGTQLLLHPAHHGLHGARVRHIGPVTDDGASLRPEGGGQSLGLLLLLDVVDADRIAAAGQQRRRGGPDAPGGTGNESDFFHFSILSI